MKHIVLKRSIAVLLIAVMLLGAFTACGSTDGNGGETTTAAPNGDVPTEAPDSSTEEETTAEPVQDFVFYEDGAATFTLVYPDECTESEMLAVNELKLFLENMMDGASIEIKTDLLRIGETHDKESREILVGSTNYEETKTVLKSLDYGEYAVDLIGNKLVLVGWQDSSVMRSAYALSDIMNTHAYVSDKGSLILPASAVGFSDVSNELLNDIPHTETGELQAVYDCGTDTYELIIDNVEASEFDAYLQKLEEYGYTKYTENARGTVRFATYTGKARTINVYHQEHYKDLRVIVEAYNHDALPPKEAAYEKVTDTAFAQVGLEYSNNQIGHCFIWKLEDGRFIIVDGGYTASIVYNALKTMADDPNNIVIAAWIISHFHPDHNNAFKSFGGQYGGLVKLQSVIWNSPSKDQYSYEGTSCYEGQYLQVMSSLKRFSGSPTVYKAHPGQVYHFSNAKIEILYTLEMYAPNNLQQDDLNTTSLVFDVSFGSFNMMITNDMTERANRILRNNYGDTLQSEVGQVAHHGYHGGSYNFYALVHPIYGLFTTGLTHYQACKNDDRNNYFITTNGRLEKVYVAGDDVFLFGIEKDVGFVSLQRYNNISDFMQGIEIPA